MTLKKLAEIVIEGFKKQDEFNHKQEDFNAYIEKKIDKLETKVDDGFKKQDEFNNYIKNEVEELKVAQRKTDEKLEKVIKLNNLKS
ncbi:MAG: hypothetical protein LBC44_01090 [Mycoplasmataceae bacterium]|jgi:flagellar hook-basal body complex protein FliE|nr:hypothetical protein [Mycoplasmataceae bacterium]